jgi:uncharacterized protein
MAAGSSDLVDCARLAEEAAALRRVYEMGELPRLRDLLAEPRGTLSATFAFTKLASGRPGARVSIEASPQLVCQRCMQGFGLRATGASEIEFATSEDPAESESESEREFFRMENGRVSLRELAEEELLLALPISPACNSPQSCGKAPSYAAGDETAGATGDMRRPFSALQDLLKKT